MSRSHAGTGTATGHTTPASAGSLGARLAADSGLDSSLFDRGIGATPHLSRWMGWRLRLLVTAALLGCLGLFGLARWLAEPLHVDAAWRADAKGRPELVATGQAELVPYLACAPGAVAEAKALFRSLTGAPDEAVIADTIERLVTRWESPEAADGIAAFFADRKPPWAQ